MTSQKLTTDDLPDFGRVIPVIVIHNLDDAVPVAQALVNGGVRVLEITLRTPAGLNAIERVAAEVPDAIVGAGTVLSAADASACAKAGAQFVVSPGFTANLARGCSDLQLPLLPGVSSASEVMNAAEAGLNFLKFFPAVAAGGIGMLKGLAGPFGDVSFCPTGGITPENAAGFLSLPNVRCVGGSWLTPADALQAKDWARITSLAREASKLA